MKNRNIIGIQIRTSNMEGQAVQDLGKLWESFYAENMVEHIPNKLSDTIYTVYTDYQSDYTGKYTAIIGMEVTSLNEIPDNLIGRSFDACKYEKFQVIGEMPLAIVDTRKKIWEMEKQINRAYTADFEIYNISQDGKNNSIEILVSVQ